MRTQEEIVKRIQQVLQKDTFGFEYQIYFGYIDFEHAKPILDSIAPEATAEGWNREDQAVVLKDMEEYMAFAWGKANDRRGISALRSIKHYIAWTWLLGDEEFSKEVEGQLSSYRYYGKEILISICAKYGWDYTQYDDGVRTNE